MTDTATHNQSAERLALLATTLYEISGRQQHVMDALHTYNEQTGEYDGGPDYEDQHEAHDELMFTLDNDLDKLARIADALTEIAATEHDRPETAPR